MIAADWESARSAQQCGECAHESDSFATIVRQHICHSSEKHSHNTTQRKALTIADHRHYTGAGLTGTKRTSNPLSATYSPYFSIHMIYSQIVRVGQARSAAMITGERECMQILGACSLLGRRRLPDQLPGASRSWRDSPTHRPASHPTERL